MEVLPVNYMPGDPLFIDKIVYELKSQGMFDGFRRECMSDVDTKPAYQNLWQRVESAVNAFLRKQKWNPEMNKNHVREQLRKNLCESGFLEPGVERIVDQVVNPKTNSVFLPKVTDIVYENLGLQRPNTSARSDKNLSLSVDNLLPHDLEAVSPESSGMDDKMDSLQSLEDNKMEEDESPPFEPIEENVGTQEENSVDSHLSGFSGLVSHDSNQSDSQKPVQVDGDTQMSKPSSDGRSSVVEEQGAKMDVGDDSKGFEPESSDKSSSSNKSDKKEHRKDERRSDKDKDRRDKDKERSRDKDRSRSDKHKSRSSGHGDKRDDKKSDRDKKDKYRSSKDKDLSGKDKKSSSKDKDSSSKDKELSSKDKELSSKDKELSSKDRDSSSKDKDSSSKDKDSSSKDKDRSRDRRDSRSKHKSSSSSKHSSSSDKKKESSKDKSKDRKEHRDSKDKKSSSSSKDEKSRSSSHSQDKYKKSSSSRKDKDKKRRDKDDHFGSKQRPERRSTDRDSNDGSGLKSSSSSYSESNSSSQNSTTHVQKTQEVNSNSNSTDSGNSDSVERRRAVTLGPEQLGDELLLGASSLKLIKPKIASNIHEARRLMKIRKQLKRIEMQGEYAALEALKRKEEKKEVREGLSVSMDKWNELEAKLNESVNFDAYYDPESEPKVAETEVKPTRNNGESKTVKIMAVENTVQETEGSVKENKMETSVEVVTTVEMSENIVSLEVSENHQSSESKADVEMDTEVEVEPNSTVYVNAEVEVNSKEVNVPVEANNEVEPKSEDQQIDECVEVELNTEVEENVEVKINAEAEVNDEQMDVIESNAEVEQQKVEVEINSEVESESTSTIKTTAAIEETPQSNDITVEVVGTTVKPDCNQLQVIADSSNDKEISAKAAAIFDKSLGCNRQQSDEDSADICKELDGPPANELTVPESTSNVENADNSNKRPEISSDSDDKTLEKTPTNEVTQNLKEQKSKDSNKETEISSAIITDDKPPKNCNKDLSTNEEQKVEDLLYFPMVDVREHDERAKAMLGYVGKLKREIEDFEAKIALGLRHIVPEHSDVNKENKRAGVKRKATERNEKVVRKLRNNNNLVDVTAHDEKFSMPLSPAESDKSIDKKIETDTQARVVEKPPPPTVGRKKRVSKSYTNEDLYKPRPLIKRTTRSRRGAQID